MVLPPSRSKLLHRAPDGALGARMRACHTASEARALLLRDRLYGFADPAWFTGLDPQERSTLTRELRALRAIEAARQQARATTIANALHALQQHGITPILLKGGALARTLYTHTYERPSIDLDVLIAPHDQPRVHAVMDAIGWTLPFGVRGQYTSHQFSYYSPGPPLLQGVIDVHWRITNRPALAYVLAYPQLVDSAVDIDFEGVPARAIDRPHALVHALVHLVAHHRDDVIPALWYYDIALLDEAMTDEERQSTLALLGAQRLQPLAARVLADCRRTLGCTTSAVLIRGLTPFEDAEPAWWQRLPAHRITDVLADLAALRGIARLHYLREVLIPNERSLRAAYGEHEAATPLWRLHLRRWTARGIKRTQ